MPEVTDLRSVSGPLYAWMVTHTRNDRRHVAMLATPCVDDLSEIVQPPRGLERQAFQCKLFVGPIGDDDPYWDLQKAYFAAREKGDWKNVLGNLPLIGASWTPRAPRHFRLASRRMADAVDANIYAEIAAEARNGALPVVIQLLNPGGVDP